VAHHSSQHDPFMRAVFEQALPNDQALPRLDRATDIPVPGPTGVFPRGKLTAHDEGEIRMGVAAVNGAVVLDFGSRVSWVGMTPDQADAMAESLRAKAAEIRGEG
jgi:hypothetical protein